MKVAPASSQYWTATIPEDGSINPNYVETDIAVRFYLYFVALPTNTRDIWTHQPNSTADYARLMYNASSGKLAVAWGSGALTDGPTVTTGVEYIIDLKVVISANPRTFDWQVATAAQTQITKAVAGETGTPSTIIGPAGPTDATYDIRIDDYYATSDVSVYPIGDGWSYLLKPNGVGTHNNPTDFENDDSSAIDSSSWTRLDEVPYSNADYVKQINAVAASYLEFTFDNMPSGQTPNGVSGLVVMESATEVNGAVGEFRVRDGSTETLVVSDDTPYYAGEVFWAPPGLFTNGITPASSWSESAVNGLVGRVGYDDPSLQFGLDDPIAFDALYLEVDLQGETPPTTNQTVNPDAIASDEAFGDPQLAPEGTVIPIGIVSSGAFGTLALGGPSITSFTPSSGPTGTQVVVTGHGFLRPITSIDFNGTNAPDFIVDSDTQLSVAAPFGGTTGPITIVTSFGSATSATDFTYTMPVTTGGDVAPLYEIHTTNFDGSDDVTLVGADGRPAFSDLSWSKVLNDSSTATFICPDYQSIITPANLDVGKKIVNIYRNSLLVWSGPLIRATVAPGNLQFGAVGWYEFFKYRYLTPEDVLTYPAADPFEVLWNVFEYFNAQSDTVTIDRGLTLGPHPKRRDFEFDWWDFNTLASIVETVIQRPERGMDFWVDQNRKLNMSRRPGQDNATTLERGVNIEGISLQTETTDTFTQVIVKGLGDGLDTKHGITAVDDTLDDAFTRRMGFWDKTPWGYNSQTLIDEAAQNFLDVQQNPQFFLSLAIRSDVVDIYAFDLTDNPTIIFDPAGSYIQINGTYRCTSQVFSLANSGRETRTATFDTPDRVTNP